MCEAFIRCAGFLPATLASRRLPQQQRHSSSGALPAAQVEHESDGSVVQVDRPEQFSLATAASRAAASELAVTGAINPDVSRNVPVVSLASGRVVEIHARLGDTVTKGQPLLSVRSDDVSGGYSDYHKAVADETLARTQLRSSARSLRARSHLRKTISKSLKTPRKKAKADLDTTAEHLRLLGNDPDRPSGVVEIDAPVSGVITDQEVTIGASVQAYGSNPFTISDLSSVWILCDVHENDLPAVRLGDLADIRLNAYPDQVFKGTVSNIGAILDPAIRAAKVRIEVRNPGIMRLGMFVTATFRGQKKEIHAVIPATAVLHLHDRDWVYVPASNKEFRRVEIAAGEMVPPDMQEILSGIQPGTQVVQNALVLENAAELQ